MKEREKQKTRIVIIDDHPLFRAGLKTIIESVGNFEVVGEAGSSQEGLRIAKELNPDLVLLDITLPDGNGVMLTRQLRNQIPDTRVMILSMHSKADHVIESFRAGACGYLVKESAGEKVLEGIDCVMKGEQFLDNTISEKVSRKLMTADCKTDEAYQDLTAREQEILRLRGEGLSIKEIGDKLYISPKTVENHCANLMRKLNLHSSLEMVRYAAKFGLIDIED